MANPAITSITVIVVNRKNVEFVNPGLVTNRMMHPTATSMESPWFKISVAPVFTDFTISTKSTNRLANTIASPIETAQRMPENMSNATSVKPAHPTPSASVNNTHAASGKTSSGTTRNAENMDCSPLR